MFRGKYTEQEKNLLEALSEKVRGSTAGKLLVGFDGTVDEIIEAVESRIDQDNYKRLETIKDFANRIESFSNLSGNVEFVLKTEKLGGNGPIMANALVEMGHRVSIAANLGKDAVHPVFSDMAGKCESVYSLGDPARTHAVEFLDGKVMFTKSTFHNCVNWRNFRKSLGENNLEKLFGEVDLIAANNWSQIVNMNEIWEGIMETLTKIKRANKPFFFTDLADTKKRLVVDIKEALRLLTDMNRVARVVLGLNEGEAVQVGKVLGMKVESRVRGIVRAAEEIREKIKVDMVVVHPVDFAAASKGNESAYVYGPYVGVPKLSTGAGDNFNAGFVGGLLLGVSLKEALLAGVASSGYYVRNAHSANKKQMVDFLLKMARGEIAGSS